ncbi:D-alanyl-D-alanine carboxypeptidase [Parabacteroides sp. PFB2-12]|uniref:serine hydrolase domain-containing protein n=1 Tax=unclassified Parabacteroides TaxID=2649774 RepID=UPI0024761523|nr:MULTISPECIES: serine hydrolase domain-containing protein [unclassified Parabacteroides]MDH6342149.1 D-alanyl-D-alanine carboxypeptidase [Parabacteroides sp. PM6-13]MDH6389568.1 D-alanyl-D-alanine carboxypeptidase [Parabacteroides sp. PFB2-12]
MKTFFSSFIAILLSVSVYAQEINVQKLNKLFDHIEHSNQGVGEIAIDQGGRTLYQRRFGPKTLTHSTPAGELPLGYRIGSVTKMLTAIMIYQLCEEGKLTQEDTLGHFYPDLPNADKITIAHLLSHTSGLQDYAVKNDSLLYWLCKPVEEIDIFNEIKRQGVASEPGDKFRYSNTGYYLLMQIIEKEYEKPYPEVFLERIVKPLNLRLTISGKDCDPVIAPSYELNTSKEWSEMVDFYFPNVTGLGDVVSTPLDLIVIIRSLFDSTLVAGESLTDMQPVDKETFGKGLMRFNASGKVFYGHGGDTFGTSSLALYNPEDDLSIALSLNGKSITRGELLKYVSAIIYDAEFEFPGFPEVNREKVDLTLFKRYVGTYSCQEPSISLKVFLDGENLKVELHRQPILMMEAVTERIFRNSVAKCEWEFDPENQKLYLRQRGKLFEFTRE